MTEFPEKAERTMPCTGCGHCCREEVCQIGQLVYAPGDEDPWIEGPCPGLVWKKGRWWCMLVKAESAAPVKKLIAKVLDVGMGCTCGDIIDLP